LQAEVEVLNRNPGIQPNITLSHLNEISSNLAFLQSEVRLIGSAGPIQGPIYEFTKPVEGFVSNSMRGKVNSRSVIPLSSDEKKKLLSGRPGKKVIPQRKLSSETVKAVSESDVKKRLAARNEAGRKNTSLSNQQYTSRATANDNASYNTATFGTRPTTTSAARTPKPKESTPPPSTLSTIAQSKAAAAKASAQKGVADSILSGVMAANMPAGPSDAALKSGKSGPASFNTSSGTQATLKDLQDFVVRINCESVRLSASGTSDPNMNARIVALASVKSDINDIVKQCQMDPTMEADIPITKAELQKALPALGNINSPLPQLIQSAGLPAGLSNLLPPNMQNDPQVTRQIGDLVNNYLGTFMDGISFSVKYTSEREAQAGGAKSEQFMNSSAEKKRRDRSTIETSGFPSLADLDNASNAQFTPMDSGLLISDRYAPLPSDAGRGPSRFDWKMRSKEIEAQVKKRGLKPDDFGIMPPKTVVSSDFSWRGYARMMCTRLQATMDPHLPILCGCPPMDWPGWRNAQ
jgi:hypothetical protein